MTAPTTLFPQKMLFGVSAISATSAISVLALTAMLSTAAISPQARASTTSALNPTAERIKEIDLWLSQQYPPTQPGAVIIISRDGKPLLKKAYGLADMEKNTPLQTSDTMRIASVTKPFTAMAIMLLDEDGKLSVDDDITRHLPDFPTHGRKITIAHLLTHTSGLGVHTESPKLREMQRPDTTVTEIVNFIKTLPPTSAPGDVWNYNNSGYYLLGAIIEKTAGMSYGEFLNKRIFSPLKMTGTFVEGAAGAKPVIANYRTQSGRFSPAPALNQIVAYSAGALISTADDIERWVAAVENRKLLKPATWQRVMTSATLTSGRDAQYGFGWTIRKLRGQPLIEHSGNITGFQSQVMLLPETKLSFILMTNQQHRNNAVRQPTERIAAMMIGRPFETQKPIELSEAALEAFEGTYEASGTAARVVTRAAKQLRMVAANTTGGADVLLQAYANDAFFQNASHTRYRFVRDGDGRVTQMIRIDAGDDEQVFMRVKQTVNETVKQNPGVTSVPTANKN